MTSTRATRTLIAATVLLAFAAPALGEPQDAPKTASPAQPAPLKPPSPNVDPKMSVPPQQAPSAAHKTDDNVKPVAPAPSDPGTPGLRKL